MAPGKDVDTVWQGELVQRAVVKSKELASEGEFDAAREVVRELPDEQDEIRELRAQLLEQIKEAENASLMNSMVEEAIETSQRLAGEGKFKEAAEVIRQLPDDQENLRELKKTLLGQIADVKKQKEKSEYR